MPPPLEFTQDVADRICARIASGESVRSIVKDETMPCSATVYKWLREVPAFAEQYARSREDQADCLAEEMLDVARQAPERVTVTIGDEATKEQIDSGDVAHRRLQIDTLKWRAGKLRPKVYGDKIQQEITGTLSLEQILSQAAKPLDDRS